MFTFDVAMPLMLFAVTIVALLLSNRVEPKLKTTFEEREFKTRDAVLFVVLIAVAVSVVVFVPGMALIAIFLFSYSSLLFTFSYLFSGIKRRNAQIFFIAIGIAGLTAGAVALLNVYGDRLVMFYGGLAALGLAVSAFSVVLYEQMRGEAKPRLYLAVFPPVLFLLVFFLFMYGKDTLLALVILDVSGALFAVLITLYLASLFTWKVTFIFAALLTVMDIILVLVTGFMVAAAEHVSGLGLPVLISLPIVPFVLTVRGLTFLSLGLGDFFFAGTLATQTYKKYGRKTALVAAVAMTVSFGVFEALLLSTEFGAFPGTVMIILGWLPVVAWKLVSNRKNRNIINVESKV
jgi:hypothetical protein